MMTRRETKLMMSTDLNMNVRSGVTQKNTNPSRGRRRNAFGLLAAHVLSAMKSRRLVVMTKNATTKRAGKLERINAARRRV
jgi:hypothetical protein